MRLVVGSLVVSALNILRLFGQTVIVVTARTHARNKRPKNSAEPFTERTQPRKKVTTPIANTKIPESWLACAESFLICPRHVSRAGNRESLNWLIVQNTDEKVSGEKWKTASPICFGSCARHVTGFWISTSSVQRN